ncbi:MAG: hemerythrin domain-containing protein [Alphaproteobacteria bacterium]
MADKGTVTSDGAALRAEDFRRPLEFLFTEHDRQRVLCAALGRLAEDPAQADAAANAQAILDYMRSRLGDHYGDEEHDLFPLLRRRADPDDGLVAILDLLHDEHAADDGLLKELLGPLATIAAGRAPEDVAVFKAAAYAFSLLQRRHLAWENGTILPLARRRLTAEDQRELGRRMAARRGLVLA